MLPGPPADKDAVWLEGTGQMALAYYMTQNSAIGDYYIQQLERGYIVAAIAACNGVGTHAAELLKMSYRSFRHYFKKYNIT